jgi:hypothetical protein
LEGGGGGLFEFSKLKAMHHNISSDSICLVILRSFSSLGMLKTLVSETKQL